MINIERQPTPKIKPKKESDPQDNQEYLAAEPILQAKHGINPCGAEFWDPGWDKDPFAIVCKVSKSESKTESIKKE